MSLTFIWFHFPPAAQASWRTSSGRKQDVLLQGLFITLFYFIISPFLSLIKDKNLNLLNELNDLIIKLSENINDQNYYDIIIFLQKNKFDSNNEKIDEIIRETNEEKKEKLIKQLKVDDKIDFSSSGIAASLGFPIFSNSI